MPDTETRSRHGVATPTPARLPPPGYPAAGRHLAVDLDDGTEAYVARHFRPRRPVRSRLTERLASPGWMWVVVMAADMVGLGVIPVSTRGSGRLPLVAFAVLSILLFQARGLYRPHLHLSVLDEVPALLPRTVAAALVIGGGVALLGLRPSTGPFAELAALGVGAQLVLRAIAYAVLRWIRAHGLVSQGCLLVGGGSIAAELARTLAAHRGYGLRVRGYLDDSKGPTEADLTVTHLGDLSQLNRVVVEQDVRVVIVAFGRVPEAALVQALRTDELVDCEVLVVPRLFEVYSWSGRSDHVGGIPVVRLRRPKSRSVARTVGRGLDIVVCGAAFLLASPLLVGAALAVRIEGGPRVLFRQVRIGRAGRPFELLKFRSMAPIDVTESQTTWSIAQDDRIGPVGRFLRRTSIDELPQLWNILRGDMALVGPRPERPHFVELFTDEYLGYSYRHRVRPGLTGLAQVNGLRGDTSIGDRVRFDNYYIENWTLWLDVKIMIATIREVVGARGG